ncbi:hypothetical protein Cme02nite_63760 [Catellatospora methionotrophica]|uniref:Uncharacterized protein n=1 Tax=Catellatospora methionotrophica TaxID=121620 RepID=A0A8J3LFV5_9ACTN|nr:hypothetical protein [Catellatospora methionotrophica]GIG18044.1 hypothetical protein Cme02nite_63760 [Catellatospora methionotrophica]
MITSDEVLAQFDRAAKRFDFPDPENGYYYAIDSRLHAFRDATRWALVVELVGYSPRAGNVLDVLHCFGNCLTEGEPGYGEGDFLARVDNMYQLEHHAEPERLRGGRPPVVVRGQALDVDAVEGERLEDVFRRLVPEHRDLLLADEVELRHRLPADLPRVLVLEQWWHRDPDRFDQLPSETETFQQLAQVLTTGDVAAYQPTHAPNTHWSYWPESGSL